MKRLITTLMLFILIISCQQAGDDIAGSGSRTGNAINGQLINEDGSPAANADVNFIPAALDPRSSGSESQIVTVSTDANGYFGTSKALTGTYNILADSRNGKMVFKDSISLDGDTTLPAMKVKAAGCLRIVFKLAPIHDPRNIETIFWGTNYSNNQILESGLLYIPKMASGRYPVRFRVSLEYDVIDTVITINPGECTDMDTMTLGVPQPLFTSFTIDTLNEKITLSWTKRDTLKVDGYNIASNSDSKFTTDSSITISFLPLDSNYFTISLKRKNGTTSPYPQTRMLIEGIGEPKPLFTKCIIDTANEKITLNWKKQNPSKTSYYSLYGFSVSSNTDNRFTSDTTITISYLPLDSNYFTISLKRKNGTTLLYPPTSIMLEGIGEPKPLFTKCIIDTANEAITLHWTKRNLSKISGYKISTNAEEKQTTDTTATLKYYPNKEISATLQMLTPKGNIAPTSPTVYTFTGISKDSLKPKIQVIEISPVKLRTTATYSNFTGYNNCVYRTTDEIRVIVKISNNYRKISSYKREIFGVIGGPLSDSSRPELNEFLDTILIPKQEEKTDAYLIDNKFSLINIQISAYDHTLLYAYTDILVNVARIHTTAFIECYRPTNTDSIVKLRMKPNSVALTGFTVPPIVEYAWDIGLTGNFVIGSADTTITKAARDTLYSACRIKNEFNLYYIDTTRIVWDSSKTTP